MSIIVVLKSTCPSNYGTVRISDPAGAILEEVDCEGMAEHPAGRTFRDARGQQCLARGGLHDGVVHMLAIPLPGSLLDVAAGRGKARLPGELPAGAGVLPCQSVRQLDPLGSGCTRAGAGRSRCVPSPSGGSPSGTRARHGAAAAAPAPSRRASAVTNGEGAERCRDVLRSKLARIAATAEFEEAPAPYA